MCKEILVKERSINFITSVLVTSEYAAILVVFKKNILFLLKTVRSTFKNHEDVFLHELFGRDPGENNST